MKKLGNVSFTASKREYQKDGETKTAYNNVQIGQLFQKDDGSYTITADVNGMANMVFAITSSKTAYPRDKDGNMVRDWDGTVWLNVFAEKREWSENAKVKGGGSNVDDF